MHPIAETLSSLIDHALKPGFTIDPISKRPVSSPEQPGFLQVMGQKDSRAVQTDIPTVCEMLTLLQHYLVHLPITEMTLGEDLPEIALKPGVLVDDAHKRVLLLVACEADTLPYVAHYVADRIPSGELKARAGTLALSFVIETHGQTQHLIPEWHAAWYVANDPDHCIPVLALQSVLQDEHFSGDWVDLALQRMGVFRLPRAKAIEALRPRNKADAVHDSKPLSD